jgi:hypothetical protein
MYVCSIEDDYTLHVITHHSSYAFQVTMENKINHVLVQNFSCILENFSCTLIKRT